MCRPWRHRGSAPTTRILHRTFGTVGHGVQVVPCVTPNVERKLSSASDLQWEAGRRSILTVRWSELTIHGVQVLPQRDET